MTEQNLNAPVNAEQETVSSNRLEAKFITTTILEEHPTPAVMGAEAPPSVSAELSAPGPFGAY